MLQYRFRNDGLGFAVRIDICCRKCRHVPVYGAACFAIRGHTANAFVTVNVARPSCREPGVHDSCLSLPPLGRATIGTRGEGVRIGFKDSRLGLLIAGGRRFPVGPAFTLTLDGQPPLKLRLDRMDTRINTIASLMRMASGFVSLAAWVDALPLIAEIIMNVLTNNRRKPREHLRSLPQKVSYSSFRTTEACELEPVESVDVDREIAH